MIRKFRNDDSKKVQAIYRAAFGGQPWYETLSEEEIVRRWGICRAKPGFDCLVAEEKGEIIGATWWDTPTIEELRQERGGALADFARIPQPTPQRAGHPIIIVWLRETIVIPSAQRRGIAQNLKKDVLRAVRCLPKPTLILTRMRDDNIGIIRINTDLGFQRTGIRVPSSQRASVAHEYWYLLITNNPGGKR